VGKAIEADDNEISLNPRSRSAHLRVAERLEGNAA
jgi:16S rRNA C1402 N4-methylase RsmH